MGEYRIDIDPNEVNCMPRIPHFKITLVVSKIKQRLQQFIVFEIKQAKGYCSTVKNIENL